MSGTSHEDLIGAVGRLTELMSAPSEGDEWLKALQAKSAALEGAVGEQIQAITARMEEQDTARAEGDAQMREVFGRILVAIEGVITENKALEARTIALLDGVTPGASGEALGEVTRNVATLSARIDAVERGVSEMGAAAPGDSRIEGQIDPFAEEAASQIREEITSDLPRLIAAALRDARPDIFGEGSSSVRERARAEFSDGEER